MMVQKYEPQLVLTLDVGRHASEHDLTFFLESLPIVSIILYHKGADERSFQKQAQRLVPFFQENNKAVLIADNTQIVGRTQADGVHFTGSVADFKTLASTYKILPSPTKGQEKEQAGCAPFAPILGYGAAQTRHEAMEAGEMGADYLFFGKLGCDQKAHAFTRNFSLASWWSPLMQVPAVLQAGCSIESFSAALTAQTEFIAVESLLLEAQDKQAIVENLQQELDVCA